MGKLIIQVDKLDKKDYVLFIKTSLDSFVIKVYTIEYVASKCMKILPKPQFYWKTLTYFC